MFGSNVLDVAIGMIFVYLLLSLICSAVNEIIEAWLKKRATDLERGIRELLHDQKGDVWVKDLYDHPLVGGLFRGEYKTEHIGSDGHYQVKGLIGKHGHAHLPSYIPSRNFALALLDLVSKAKDKVAPAADDGKAAAAADGGEEKDRKQESLEKVARAVEALTKEAGGDAEKARKSVEKWFDSSMDRVSGWYKRRSQVIILFLGFGVTVFANADTIAISKSLANDPSVRQSLVAASQEYAKSNTAPSPGATPAPTPAPQESTEPASTTAAPTPTPLKECEKDINSPECRVAKNLHQLEKFGLPIGWDLTNRNAVPTPPWLVAKGDSVAWWTSVGNWLLKLLGWLVTAAAISLGAPFWFDLLNKFMIVRSTVKPHEKSPEEKPIG
ncbi:MAG TPA: hypothetical protein VF240_03290 [Pyrinomonadaceae bacterium]